MVNLTRIYTRTGDGGETRLGDMSVTTKNDTPAARLRRRRRGERAARGGPGSWRPRGGRPRRPDTRAERPLRRRRRPGHARRRGPGVPAAAHRAGLRRPARGLVRPLQRGPADAAVVHPQRRHPRRRAPARRPDRRTPRRARRVGGVRRARRGDEHARDDLPQPALRPALHPGPARQPRAGRRAVGARRRAWRQRRKATRERPRQVGLEARRQGTTRSPSTTWSSATTP